MVIWFRKGGTGDNTKRKLGVIRFPLRIPRISWRDLVIALGPILVISVVAIWVAIRFVRPALPDTITITSGPEGSGTRSLVLTLLKANGIEAHGPTRLVELGGEAAVQALLKHQVDAVFLTGDSATPANMRKLVRTRGIRLLDFVQADGYARRFRYLNKLELPMGSIDLGNNIPAKDLSLIAPTVELVARAACGGHRQGLST